MIFGGKRDLFRDFSGFFGIFRDFSGFLRVFFLGFVATFWDWDGDFRWTILEGNRIFFGVFGILWDSLGFFGILWDSLGFFHFKNLTGSSATDEDFTQDSLQLQILFLEIILEFITPSIYQLIKVNSINYS